jgi:hypothetical protein
MTLSKFQLAMHILGHEQQLFFFSFNDPRLTLWSAHLIVLVLTQNIQVLTQSIPHVYNII